VPEPVWCPPALKLCKKTNQEAQHYSEVLASPRMLKPSPESSHGQFGENLACASCDQTGKEMADRWYSEIKNYNFQQPDFISRTLHSHGVEEYKEDGSGEGICK